MPLHRVGGKLIYFSHIPKTGGTSIEKYLINKGEVSLLQTRSEGWSLCLAQHVHHKILENLVPRSFFDVGFVVLRDPKDRLISEYRMRVELNDRLPLNILKPPLRRIEHILRRFRPFPDFDTWVRQVFSRYTRNPYVYANHIRPQVEFVCDTYKLFKFEDGLEKVYSWIDEVTETVPDNHVHERKGDHKIEVRSSIKTDALIKDFYREDYDLISRI